MADEFGGIPVGDSGSDEFGGVPVSGNSGAPAPAPKDTGGIGKNIRAGLTELATGTPDSFIDPVRPLINAITSHLPDEHQLIPNTGTSKPMAPLPAAAPLPEHAVGHVLNQGLGLIGLNPEDVTANSWPERAARMGGMGLGAALFPSAAGEEMAGLMAPRIGNVVSRAANTPLKTLGRKVLTGTVAGVTGETAGEAVPDNDPVLKGAVTTLGAIAGGAAAEAPAIANAARPAIKRFVQPMTTVGQDQIAADTLRLRSTNPSGVLESLDKPGAALVPNSQPTTFQQTGDMGLGSLEREVATKNPDKFMQRRTDQNAARHDALEGVQQGGDPNTVGTFLRGHFRDIDDQTQQHIDALTAQAHAQTEGLGGNMGPEEYGTNLRASLQDAETAARARERGLWQAVDPDNAIRVDASPTFQAAQDIQGGMSRMAAPMSGDEQGIFDAISGDKNLSLGELSDLRSRVSTAARAEQISNGNSPSYARLIRLRGAIQNNLADAAAGKVAQDSAAVQAGTMAPEDALYSKLQGAVNDFYTKRATQAGTAVGEGAEGRAASGQAGAGVPDGADIQESGRPGSAQGNKGVQNEPTVGPYDFSNPGGPGKDGLHGRETKLGNTTITYGVPKSGPVEVSLIKTPPKFQGQGSARAAMEQFLAQADAEGRAVALTPEPMGKGTTKSGLNDFYESLGFVPNKGRAKDFGTRATMIREPQPSREPSGPGSTAGDQGVSEQPEPVEPRPLDETDASRLADATQATKDRAGTFGRGPTKDVLAKAGTQDVYKLPEARVPEKFFHAGPTSYSDIQGLRSTVGDEAALPILRDYAASSLRKAAERPDGTLDPGKVAAWQRKYSGPLRAFPDLGDKFSTAANASDAIADAVASRREAISARNSTALGKVTGAQTGEDVTKTIGTILGGKNAAKGMQELVDATANNPEAKQGLRQAVANHIASKFISNTEAGTSGANLFKSDAFQSFMKNNRSALATVFSPEEVRTLDGIAADLHRANRSITAVKLPGGSNSAQDLHGIVANNPNATVLDHAISEAGAAGAGAAVGHLPGAILGGLGAKIANAVRGAGFKKVDDLITEAMLNPDFAKQLLRRAPAREESGQTVALASRLRRIGQATLATRLGGSQNQGYAKGGRIIDDAGKTVPESLVTLKAQQRQLVDGNRPAMLFPAGNKNVLPVPNGMKQVKTADGLFHYNPKMVSADQIRAAAQNGHLNDILSLGPYSKDDVAALAQAGEHPLSVTERDGDGNEVRAAAGTTGTAYDQMDHFERTKSDGSTVQVEHPGRVLRDRMRRAGGGRTGSEGSGLTPEQLLERNRPWMKDGTTNFSTKLSPQDEAGFQNWVRAKGVQFDPAEATPDYDMRGFYQALQAGDSRATTAIDPNDNLTHYPDYWKTPYDATFSKQSQWANDSAPDWQGDQLIAPGGTVVWDDKMGGTPAPTPTPRPALKSGGHVHKAAFEANHEPTEAQIAAGNYRKGHVKLHGFDISVETPVGAVRRGTGPDGKMWENYHDTAHYGYLVGFPKARSKDGDAIDCYIGPYHRSKRIFVVNQIEPGNKKFDEVKIVFGTRTKNEAKDVYDAGFSDKSGPRRRWSIYEATPNSLKAWLKDGNTKKPFSPLRPNTRSRLSSGGTAPDDDRFNDILASGDINRLGGVLKYGPPDASGSGFWDGARDAVTSFPTMIRTGLHMPHGKLPGEK